MQKDNITRRAFLKQILTGGLTLGVAFVSMQSLFSGFSANKGGAAYGGSSYGGKK